MKEIEFKFDDKGWYLIRLDESGDSICGDFAHKIMFAMHKKFNYVEPSLTDKINFILSFYYEHKHTLKA